MQVRQSVGYFCCFSNTVKLDVTGIAHLVSVESTYARFSNTVKLDVTGIDCTKGKWCAPLSFSNTVKLDVTGIAKKLIFFSGLALFFFSVLSKLSCLHRKGGFFRKFL